ASRTRPSCKSCESCRTSPFSFCIGFSNATLLPFPASVKIAKRPRRSRTNNWAPQSFGRLNSREVCSEKQILFGAVSADHLCRVSPGFCSGSTETESVKHGGRNQLNRQDGAADCSADAPPTRAQPEPD